MGKRYYSIIALLFVCTLGVYACRCKDISVSEGIGMSDIVFKGKVLSIVQTFTYEDVGLQVDTTLLSETTKRIGYYFPLYFVTLEVEMLYKGEATSDTISILTPVSGAACGYRHFEKDYSYIIYASKHNYLFRLGANNRNSMVPLPETITEPDRYWTNHCTRTQHWIKEEEDEILTIIQAD